MMKFLNENKFTFGKHKNDDIYEVLKDNPSYIKWCMYNIKDFAKEIPEDIYNKLTQKSEPEGRYLGSRGSGFLISWLFD